MDVVLHAFNGVATVMIIVAVGFALERKGWITEENTNFISRLVNNVCLPLYMLTTMLARFKHDQLLGMLGGMLVPFITQVLGILASHALAHICRISAERKGIFAVCCSQSNSIFIGLPLCIALFGEESVPYVMLYYMVNTTIFWTYGVQQLASSGGEHVPLCSKATLKKLFSAPLTGFMLGIVMVLCELNLPQPVYNGFRYVGSMTTPLAMLFIGIAMSKTSWEEISIGKDLLMAMVGRFFICPWIVIAMLPFLGLPDLMGKVFVIQAALPAMVNISVVAKGYGADYKYAAMLVAVSSCLAVVIVPFYMWFIN